MFSNTIKICVLLRHYLRKDLATRSAADVLNKLEGENTTSKSAAAR
jgi:hypothetical protein